MNYSAFGQAAIEARAGLKEIDVEIEWLNAKKESLEAKRELLETLGRQLLAVMPMSGETPDRGNQAGTSPDASQAEQPFVVHSAPEGNSYSAPKEDWSSYSVVTASSETPKPESVSVADLWSQEKPHSLRTDGLPTSSSLNNRGLREVLL